MSVNNETSPVEIHPFLSLPEYRISYLALNDGAA